MEDKSINWKVAFEKFETFLSGIKLDKYQHLKNIKTVEQDLPKELIPLDILYKYYWFDQNFLSFDEIFEEYWKNRLNPHIYKFIKKYFYGCSLQFVEEGFKARLYRIWISILTQFHFQYLWNAMFDEKLFSSPEIDMKGIDAIVRLNGIRIGFQIKKVSFRREVSDRRFTKKHQKYVDVIVEVPYLVINLETMQEKIDSKRTSEKTKNTCRNLMELFRSNFIKFPNGFVVFRREYIDHIRKKLDDLELVSGTKITYDEILDFYNKERM
jgi:hypothetical protein